jgi:multicomponent Na+:H+ antiporter subunit E
MTVEKISRIVVFCLSLLVWFLITGVTTVSEVIVGLIIAFFVALLTGEMLIVTERRFHLNRVWYTILYLIKFVWEMIKANFHVAYIVIHPMLPIRPGIVKVKTKLQRDSALTMLANSITLTPGTLTVDIDKDKQILYVHWIYVKATEIEESTKEVGGRFEKLLEVIFE